MLITMAKLHMVHASCLDHFVVENAFKKKKRKRLNDGNNNGQATHGARKPPRPPAVPQKSRIETRAPHFCCFPALRATLYYVQHCITCNIALRATLHYLPHCIMYNIALVELSSKLWISFLKPSLPFMSNFL